jgi:hypothetical protein
MSVLSSPLLILTLHAGANFTRVNAVQEIRQPFFGCAEKADMEYLIELMNRLPEGSGRAHALAYGHARCIQIPKQIIEIERGDNNFACVRASQSRKCLWVPRELIGSTGLDDGVF